MKKELHYKIKQIKSRNTPYYFSNYNKAKELGFNLNDYALVYSAKMDADEELEPFDILEWLYTRFNVKKPETFRGHSLSVSDVIELNGVNYYVDDIGFKKIDA